MKQLFLCILMMSVFGAQSQTNSDVTFTQKFPTTFSSKKTIAPGSKVSSEERINKLRAAKLSGNRAQNLSFDLDYGYLDQQYAANVTLGEYYDDFITQVNRRLPIDSFGTLKWAFQWYPQIVDYVNATTFPFIEYPANKIQMTIDTILVGIGHVNKSNTKDTLVVSVWDFDNLNNINFADSGSTGTLYGRAFIITDTSLFEESTTPGNYNVGLVAFVPTTPIVIPQGKRFVIQVDFFGAINDEFFIQASRRNDCGNANCGASIPYIKDDFNAANGLGNFNSLGGLRFNNGGTPVVFPTTFIGYDCNGDGMLDTTANASQCELYYGQNFAIYPLIKAVIPNHYTSAVADVTSGCAGTNINLSATSAGSANGPYTYTWSSTSGTLSSTSGDNVVLTLGNGNAAVYVTSTDGASSTAIDTVLVTSRAINVNITSASPLSIACGASGTIVTSLTGSQTGRNYSWSNGVTGPTKTTLPVSVPGTYSVTVTNSFGCSSTATTSVVYTSGETNSVNFSIPTKVCVDVPATFLNTSTQKGAGWSASWDMLSDGTQLVLTEDATHTYTTLGQKFVTLTMTDANGCKFATPYRSKIVTVSPATQCSTIGIEETEFANLISVLPNPTNGNVNITVTGAEKNISIRVYNVIGSEVKSFNSNDVTSNFTKTIDLSDVSNGTYLVKIQSGNKIAVKRLIVSK